MPPTAEKVEKALRLLSRASALGYTEADAFAGVSGEVRVTLYKGKTYLEFTVETDEDITFVREEDGEEVDYKDGLTETEAATELIEALTRTWVTSGYFTPIITTADLGVSKASPSRIQPGAVYQSLTGNALSGPVEVYVPIFEPSTPQERVIPQSFGTSQTEPFRTALVSALPQAARVMNVMVTSPGSLIEMLRGLLSHAH